MLRTLFAVSLLAMLACGAEQSDSGATSGDTAPVSAAGSARDAIAAGDAVEVEEIEVEAIEIETAPQVSSCLDLVTQGAFSQAVPVCLEAAGIDPENAQVQAALAKAQAQTQAAALGAATDAATEKATGAATGAAADALGSFGD